MVLSELAGFMCQEDAWPSAKIHGDTRPRTVLRVYGRVIGVTGKGWSSMGALGELIEFQEGKCLINPDACFNLLTGRSVLQIKQTLVRGEDPYM